MKALWPLLQRHWKLSLAGLCLFCYVFFYVAFIRPLAPRVILKHRDTAETVAVFRVNPFPIQYQESSGYEAYIEENRWRRRVESVIYWGWFPLVRLDEALSNRIYEDRGRHLVEHTMGKDLEWVPIAMEPEAHFGPTVKFAKESYERYLQEQKVKAEGEVDHAQSEAKEE